MVDCDVQAVNEIETPRRDVSTKNRELEKAVEYPALLTIVTLQATSLRWIHIALIPLAKNQDEYHPCQRGAEGASGIDHVIVQPVVGHALRV